MRGVLLFVAAAFSAIVIPSASVTAAQGGAAPAGTVDAGRAVWATGNTSCRNCHGGEGEGAFAIALAGRKVPFQRFRDYVRTPKGRMPAYIESELTDQEIADLVAYFDSLPVAAKPSAWRTELPAGAPRGQELAIAKIGCGQCHGATFSTPRHGAAEVNGDFEWFKRMVYDHTTAQREQWAQLDPANPSVTPTPAGPAGRNRIRMGNYDRARLPEATLKEIWDWMADLGHLPVLTGRVSAGAAAAEGATYTLTVANAAVKDKGVAAEDVTVALVLPAGAKVVSATGTGYQGVRRDEAAKGDVAVWQLPRLAAADRQALAITLAGMTPDAGLRGTIRWARPAVKADPVVNLQVAGAGRGGGGRGAAEPAR
jgi:mono/diheme cytochrome c family protein